MTEERPPVWQPDEDELSLLEVGSLLLRHRRVLVYTTVVVTLLALVPALLTPRTYTSATSFVPQAPTGASARLGGLASLAGQFGVAVPAGAESQSPDFYAELVKSREILGVLASEGFAFDEAAGNRLVQHRGTLPELLKIAEAEPDALVRREAAIEWLAEEALKVSTGRQTGLVVVSAITPWPGLSHALANRVLELVNAFNLETRQTQAAAERGFIETRLSEVQDSLRAAEDRLKHFLENNRQWAGSPELTFQRDRLQREVVMQQQVYTGLAEAYEQARIAEVRDTPVITVVERPELPVKADPRNRVLTLTLGIGLGAILGVFLAFMSAYSERARRVEDGKYRALSEEWARTRAEIRSLFGLKPW